MAKYTKRQLEWLRQRQAAGGSLSQGSENVLAEAEPGSVIVGGSRVVRNGARQSGRTSRSGGHVNWPGGHRVRTYGNIDDALAAAKRMQEQTSPDNGNMFEEGGGPADTGKVQPGPDGHYHDSQGRIVSRRAAQEELDRQQGRVSGRKRTELPTNDVGVNETEYMRRKRGETDFDSVFRRQRGDTHAHLGGFGLGLSAASREGMAELGLRATNRRWVLDSVAANAAEGRQAHGDLTQHVRTLQEQQAAARQSGEIDAAKTAGAMSGAMDAARTWLGSTDRKFSSGQGFSAKSRKSLSGFAGRMVDTTVDSLREGIDRSFDASKESSLAGGRGANAKMHAVSLDMNRNSSDMEAASVKMGKAGDTRGFIDATDQFIDAVQRQSQSTKDFIKSSQEQSAHTKEFLADHEKWREDTEKEIEDLKKQMGKADWGGGVSGRARRFIDRRREETSAVLSRFFGGKGVA